MSSLEELNEQQRQAVAHRHGPAIVIAGPGAGKTKVLTTRAAALIQEGIRPERILLLTFTRASAKAMTTRAKTIDERAEFLTSGTFHSWAIKILNANAHVFGLDKPFTLLDEDDVGELIKRYMGPLKGQDNWPRASTVGKVLSYAANTQKTIAESLQIKAPDHLGLAEKIEMIRNDLTKAKINNGMLSYDDVLIYLGILLEDEDIGAAIRSQYDQIMIDEYQDTNALQLAIVHGLVGNNGNVTIVGDPSQSIYGFRGSAPSTMTHFHKTFPSSKIIPLEINYRSSPEIISLVNAIDARMDIGFERNLKSAKSSGPRPIITEVADGAAEASAIADAILKDKAEGGEICEHAVLVRSTAAARRIETEFITRKIPHTVKGGVRIDEAAHIKDLLSLGRITTNLAHEPAWMRSLSRFAKIGAKAAEEMTKTLVKTTRVSEAAQFLRLEAKRRKTNIDILADALEVIDKRRSVSEGLQGAIETMRPIWSKTYEEDWKSRERDLEAILIIADEHPTMASFLTVITLDASIDRERAGSSEKAEENPVTISTIHSAKGLEWKHVHIPSFVQGGMPSLFAQSEDDYDEELRIFYVAASRAEKYLTFYKPRFNGQGNFTSPSTYEDITRGLVDHKIQSNQQSNSHSIRIDTTKKIDLRSKMLRS